MKHNEFLSGPRVGRRRAIAVAVAVALLLGVAVVVHRANANTRRTAQGTSTTAQTGTRVPESATGLGTDGLPAAGTQPPLRLVRGTTVVGGVSVGYPHTLTGAVSAAVEYLTQVGSTLESKRAAEIGRVIANSSFGDAAAYFGQGPINSRRTLGLPESGPVPPGASMTLGAVAYQIRDADGERVTVLLLGYLTTTTPTAGIQTRLGVFPLLMAWSGRDWKVSNRPADAPDFAELRHQPGTAQALAAGWQDFLQ